MDSFEKERDALLAENAQLKELLLETYWTSRSGTHSTDVRPLIVKAMAEALKKNPFLSTNCLTSAECAALTRYTS